MIIKHLRVLRKKSWRVAFLPTPPKKLSPLFYFSHKKLSKKF